MSRIATLFEQLKRRKVKKTVAIYTSTGLTVLGVTNLFAGVYQLPRALFDCILVLVVCGLPSACIVAWFHGREGKQKIQTKELVLYSLLFVIAAFMFIRIVLEAGPRLVAAGSQ